MIGELETFWRENFPGTEPSADQLKFAFPARWVRFHSLPESKRYAQTVEEYQEVMFRHNQVIADLSRDGESLFLVASEFSGSPQHLALPAKLAELMQGNEFWNTLPMHEPEEAEDFWSFSHQYVCAVPWKRGVLDPLLRMVADDEVRNIMIASSNSGWLYHPYDGGADVFLRSEWERNRVREKHRHWLSTHPEGL